MRDFKRGKGRLKIARMSTHHMYDSIIRGLSIRADGGARNQDGVTTGRSFSEESFVRSCGHARAHASATRFGKFAGSTRLRGSSSSGRTRFSRMSGDADVLEIPLATRLAPAAISIAAPACPFSKWRGGVHGRNPDASKSRHEPRLDVFRCVKTADRCSLPDEKKIGRTKRRRR